MSPPRGLDVRHALLLFALGVGCRGEARPPAPQAPPADEKLAWPAVDEASLVAAIATAGYTLGTPEPLAIAPDGAVLFRRAKARDPVADLYQLDPAGKVALLAAAQALLATPPTAAPPSPGGPGAPPAAAPRGIEAIELSDDGARVLVPLAGRLFVIERATGAARELAVGPHRDPRMAPDGKQVAFVQGGDLWVAPITDHPQPVRLTQHPPDREYAAAEPGAAALGRSRGYWWSPDSQAIAFERSDSRAVDTHYLGDPRHPERAPIAVKVARAGRPLPIVDLGIVSVHGGAPRWVTWDTARYPYLARVVWPQRGALSLVVIAREQTQVAVLAADPATGATRPLLVDKDPAWINLTDAPLSWLADGSGFLWMTEAGGSWGLDRHAADGAVAGTVVTPDVGLRRVVGLGPDGRDVIIEATDDPRELHVLRVPLAGGAPTALTSGGGVHHAIAGHGSVVVTSLNRAGGRVVAVLRAAGTRSELPSVAERPRAPPVTRLEQVQLDDHIQYAAITRPHSFDPKVRYPVVLRIVAEPESNAVLDAPDLYLADQWWADAGFIVVVTDGRGTPGRDRTWQHRISGDVVTLPLNDQLGAVKLLGARSPELDRSRVGAIGAGMGGFLATLGVLLHPDALAAGVARSPYTDWELLDAAYAERYMRSPAGNAEGYRRASAASYAEQLKRPLLLVASVADERGEFSHSLALLDALSAAGKHAGLATVPTTPDLASELATTRLELAFLRDHLGPPVRPSAMPVARSEEEEEEEERERERGKATPDKQREGDSAKH